MALDYQLIKNWAFEDIHHSYTEKDVILYALGLGLGQDPVDENQLRFVYEKDLKVFPTMGAVLGYPGFWMKDPRAGINWVKIVHGEQRMRLHKPFPAGGAVVAKLKVSHVIDKGADKGALVIVERQIFDASDDSLLATIAQTNFCRADGGFGVSDPAPEALPKVPDRAPDRRCELPILPQAALLYRLNGDFNPLHADPEVAKQAGYPKPILHGLCTYGMAGRGVLQAYADNDPVRLTRFDTRFSAPVYPGETLVVEMWDGEDGYVQFQARVRERDIVVLSNGVAHIA